MRRALPVILLVTGIGCGSSAPTRPSADLDAPLHERALVIDTHADTPTEYLEKPFDLGAIQQRGHFDYPRMVAGGLDAEFFVAYVPRKFENNGAAAFCLKIMETIHEMVERHPNFVSYAQSTDDIRRIVGGGKKAILIGIEGGHAIEDSLEILRSFYRLGARYMTLTHTNNNNWADSSGEEPEHDGLTDFGKQVILEMNRLGMLVDISHVSDKTFFDVVAVSKAPVFASHSSARALAEHNRNMTDEMLRALANNGGVVMVNFNPPFLSTEVALASSARSKRLAPAITELRVQDPAEGEVYQKGLEALYAQNPIPNVPYTVIVDHIDHMVKVAGIDHVGLGSDFDGISSIPIGMEDASRLPKITEELRRRGYSEGDVRKILGENFMRVFGEVERGARTKPN
ncbi:MAG TPA: dipeptidase [Thermoanaerobaculia bacterium]